MSRPPAPSLRPVRNVVATAIGLAVLGRLLVGAGGPGVFGIVVIVLALIASAGVVLARLRAGEHQREADIPRHRTFVELVEDHESDVGEGGIVDQASGQDALGDDHQTGCRPDRPVVARDPPHGFACVFAEESGQPASRRSGCHPARLEQHDRAAVEPRLIEQAKR